LILLHADGGVGELDGERTYPPGVRFTERAFPLLSTVVEPGIVCCSTPKGYRASR
jgi:hypothetical protein